MAVDIWLPRLKIANVGRASPEKIIKHFLEQAPWEISNSKSWKNNENVNKTLHLPHCAGTALFVKFIYTYPHMDSAVFVRVNSRGSVGDLFGYRAYFPPEFEHAWRAVLFVLQTIKILMI